MTKLARWPTIALSMPSPDARHLLASSAPACTLNVCVEIALTGARPSAEDVDSDDDESESARCQTPFCTDGAWMRAKPIAVSSQRRTPARAAAAAATVEAREPVVVHGVSAAAVALAMMRGRAGAVDGRAGSGLRPPLDDDAFAEDVPRAAADVAIAAAALR